MSHPDRTFGCVSHPDRTFGCVSCPDRHFGCESHLDRTFGCVSRPDRTFGCVCSLDRTFGWVSCHTLSFCVEAMNIMLKENILSCHTVISQENTKDISYSLFTSTLFY